MAALDDDTPFVDNAGDGATPNAVADALAFPPDDDSEFPILNYVTTRGVGILVAPHSILWNVNSTEVRCEIVFILWKRMRLQLLNPCFDSVGIEIEERDG